MLSASAAPRWKRHTSTLPRASPRTCAANAVRRRNDGVSPSVTSARAPDLTKTRRCMGEGRWMMKVEPRIRGTRNQEPGTRNQGRGRASAALELGGAEGEADDQGQAVEWPDAAGRQRIAATRWRHRRVDRIGYGARRGIVARGV